MEEPEYRVYVRIPVPRPSGFIDPPSFIWNTEKEATLWKVISRRTRGDINCISPLKSLLLLLTFLCPANPTLYFPSKRLVCANLDRDRVSGSIPSRCSLPPTTSTIPLRKTTRRPPTPNATRQLFNLCPRRIKRYLPPFTRNTN